MGKACAIELRPNAVVERRARERQGACLGRMRIEDAATERCHRMCAGTIAADELQVDRCVYVGLERVVASDGRAAPAAAVCTAVVTCPKASRLARAARAHAATAAAPGASPYRFLYYT